LIKTIKTKMTLILQKNKSFKTRLKILSIINNEYEVGMEDINTISTSG